VSRNQCNSSFFGLFATVGQFGNKMDYMTYEIVALFSILFDVCWNDCHVVLNLWQF